MNELCQNCRDSFISVLLPGTAIVLLMIPLMSMAGGNQLNVDRQAPALGPDKTGLNPFSPNTRSSTGLLYEKPMKHHDLKALGESEWLYKLSIEAGYLANFGTTGTASFREYGDWSEDPVLNRFAFTLERPGTANYFSGSGGGPGRDDQYYQFSYGKYGEYNISAAFDSAPHVFASNARVLWDGVGTGNLTLPNNLTPGASTLDEISSTFQSIGESTLSLEREKASIALSYTSLKHLKLLIKGSTEWRDGARPFGGAFTYPGLGQVTETVEPIDYLTYDLNVGIRYTDQKYQANINYTGSFFP